MALKEAKGFGNSSLEVSAIITIIDPETLPVGTCQIVSQLHTHTHTHTPHYQYHYRSAEPGPGNHVFINKDCGQYTWSQLNLNVRQLHNIINTCREEG